MKKPLSILVSIMMLCVMMEGVLLGEIQDYSLESGKYKETGTGNGESISQELKESGFISSGSGRKKSMIM